MVTTMATTATTTPLRKCALLIGLNYKRFPSIALNGCLEDIDNIRGVLIDAYGYTPSNIVALRDNTSYSYLQPTKATILNQLRALVSQSANMDEIWIHYSGHGTKMNPSSTEEFIVPIDYSTAGFISDAVIFQYIKLMKCRCILVFDSCNSGDMGNLPYSFYYSSPTAYTRTIPFPNNIITNPNIFVFSGCKTNQTSGDIYNSDTCEYVGVFTDAMVECIRNKKHTISIMDLFRDIGILITSRGYSQTPVLSSSSILPNFTLTRAT
jgi:hypothetical protein